MQNGPKTVQSLFSSVNGSHFHHRLQAFLETFHRFWGIKKGCEQGIGLGPHKAVVTVFAEELYELGVVDSQLGMAAYEGVPLRALAPLRRFVDAMLLLHKILPIAPPAPSAATSA